MKFSAPRSTSPSPTRRQYRRSSSTFGVPSDSSDEEYDFEGGSDSEPASSSAVSSSSEYYDSDEDGFSLTRPARPRRSPAEERYIDEVLVSVRLRANYHDPYEEWKSDLRQESLRIAKVDQSQAKGERCKVQTASHTEVENNHAAELERDTQLIQQRLQAFAIRQHQEEERLKTKWAARNKSLWDRIETVIKAEEDKVKARLEEERQKQEAEQRVKREAEERKRQAEERRRREEEERQKEKEREAEEMQRAAEAEKARKEEEDAEQEQRITLGFSSATDDWTHARNSLRSLKMGAMKTVKANRELRSIWSAGRRAITPKVGQLTNDPREIDRISQQLIDIILPSPSHPIEVYMALLSSLAKAIFLQAETEVTAEKRSAGPLAQVAANLLSALEGFADIFWAKLCQRTGGWPIPIVVPQTDSDGISLEGEARRKALGYKEEEGLAEYTARVTGIMRVYFHILFAEVGRPLDPVFRLPRMWTYFARMLAEPRLLESSVAPSVLHAALDVGGLQALQIWGKQWVKLLSQLYEGVTVGFHGSEGRLIGGKSSEGIAARVRVQLEIERITIH